ncbi:hypothetical protein C8Q70DRAFT_654021 [Cubamyces menziesii]|nr:hypothetical protein C8Q70DRAFT_654021 [Cubamyces menziesii]
MGPFHPYGKARPHRVHHSAATAFHLLVLCPSLAYGSPAPSSTTTAVATAATPVVTGSAACPIADCVGLVGLNSTCLSQKTCVCASSSQLIQCFPKLGNCTGENAAEIEAELADLCSTNQDWGAPFPWAAWGSMSSWPEWGAQTSQGSSTSAATTTAITQSSLAPSPTLTSSATSQKGGGGGLSQRTIIAFSVSLGVTSFLAAFGILCCLIRRRVRSWNALKSRTETPCDTKDPEQHIDAFPYTPHAHRPVSQGSRGVSDLDDMAPSETGGCSTTDSHSPLCGLSAEAGVGTATIAAGRARSGENIEAIHAYPAACRTKPPKPPGVPPPEDLDPPASTPPSLPLPAAPALPSDAANNATPNHDPSSPLATAAATINVLPLPPATLQSAPNGQAANGERYVVLPWALGERLLSSLNVADAAASPHPPLPLSSAPGMLALWEASESESEGSLGPPPEYDGPPGLLDNPSREGAEHTA